MTSFNLTNICAFVERRTGQAG